MVAKHISSPFEFANISIEAGTRANCELEIARLYTHSPLSVSVDILHGKHPGPVLLVNAAIHGDELNGVEVVRQVIDKIDLNKLHGTVIAVPVVNVFGFIHKSRYLPDRRDLNRCFPGSERGSIAGRMAYQYFSQVVRRATHVVDLHTAAIHRTNLPQIRANLDNEAAQAMAVAFGSPVVVDASLRDGSLRAAAEAYDIPVITFEAGEALRFDPHAIGSGVQGTLNVMKHLGMLRSSRSKKEHTPMVPKATRWVRADSDGLLRSHVALGEKVEKNQIIASINDPSGASEISVIAPQGGIVIGQQTLPLVNEGDAIFHIAFFDEPDSLVEEQVESYLDDAIEILDDDLKYGMTL
ncbi:succinylglutamate desuccinylase/aspartoacylase family protein [Photobacterium damselae]|uniref:succinylglutamate desuccinylase/aspartoacylase family protein n=1 Tax=Photobacterium damselae TaxID=38293 RepID=UPI001EE0C55B|nr:succinylglutamate desuccinylase/aspartoacylase family protein [Photobacterium damselae]MCG3846660.1 succinylglutamate desuccinylase/aspartoacylase family protein [Photobacterium damselae]